MTGVDHSLKVFTPTSRLLKSSLDLAITRMLRSKTKGAKPSVVKQNRHVVLVAGDNAAEGKTGHIKNTTRRVGNAGGFKGKHGLNRNIVSLSGAAFLREPGLDRILLALRDYRTDLSNGILKLSLKGAFASDKLSWLF